MIDASTTINYPPLSSPLSYLPQLPYLVAMADPPSMSRIMIGLKILMPSLILILILVSALILMPTLLLPQDLQLPYLVVMTDLGAKIFSNCFPS